MNLGREQAVSALVFVMLGLAACGDPSPTEGLVHVVDRTPPAATPSGSRPAITTPPPQLLRPSPVPPNLVASPRPIHCPPALDSGRDVADLEFTGACAFRETKAVSCPNSPQAVDDYYVQFSRRFSDGPQLYFSVNVEHYKGPGRYRGTAQIIVEIFDSGVIYEWSTSTGSADIATGGRSGSFPANTLPADVGTPTWGTEHVQGTFRCG